MKNADYRKLNDHSHSSSTYHKKDGTAVRAILKTQLNAQVSGYKQKVPEALCDHQVTECTHCKVWSEDDEQ